MTFQPTLSPGNPMRVGTVADASSDHTVNTENVGLICSPLSKIRPKTSEIPLKCRALHPSDISKDAPLLHSLLSHSITRVRLPIWSEDVDAYREALLALMSAAPGITVELVPQRGEELSRSFAALTALFPGDVVTSEHASDVTPYVRSREFDTGESSPILEGSVSGAKHTLSEVAQTISKQDAVSASFDDVEARLVHVRAVDQNGLYQSPDSLVRATEGITDEIAMKSAQHALRSIRPVGGTRFPQLWIAPGVALTRAGGLSFEAGLTDSKLGYALASVPKDQRPAKGKWVRMNPKPGKALRHEPIHAIYRPTKTSAASVAFGALSLLGHSGGSLILSSDSSDVKSGAFLFNANWQFLGLVTETAKAPADVNGDVVVRALRCKTIWDDLCTRADLGDGIAADLLALLSWDFRTPKPRVTRQSRARTRSTDLLITAPKETSKA